MPEKRALVRKMSLNSIQDAEILIIFIRLAIVNNR